MADVSICVAGGGIGGVAAAVALSQVGVRAEVYERAAALSEVGSGLSLWPNGTRALRQLGVLEEVLARSGVSNRFLVRRNDGRVLMELGIGASDVPAVCTHRADLLEILLRALPGASAADSRAALFAGSSDRVLLSHEIADVDARGARPVVTFTNGVRKEFDAVIGADGIRSRVRALMVGGRLMRGASLTAGVQSRGERSAASRLGAEGSRFFAGLFGQGRERESDAVFRGYMICRGVGLYDGPEMPAFTHSETWGPGRRAGILTMGGNRYTWYATANLRRGADGSAGEDSAWSRDPETRKRELLGVFANWHAPIPQLIESTPAESIVLHGAYDRPGMKRWSEGAVTLLGDAAHPLTPNLGQGGCLAIEDAVVLAKCVARATSIPQAFREYEQLRMSRTRHLTGRSALLGWIGQWENPAMVAVRHAVTERLPAKLFESNLRRVYSYQV